MSWSSLLKFFIGLFLAIALLASGGILTAQYFIAKLTAPPPKPTYPNDKPSPPTKTVAAKSKPAAVTADPASEVTSASKPLPAGAFEGRVSQSIGLILRDAPGRDGAQVGGIDYNEKVIVLETSADGEWQKVRLQSSDREGWVKAGNVDKLNQ